MKDWKYVLIKSLKLPSFFLDIRLGVYCQNAFVKIPPQNWFGRQRSLRLRKDNPSMVDLWI